MSIHDCPSSQRALCSQGELQEPHPVTAPLSNLALALCYLQGCGGVK